MTGHERVIASTTAGSIVTASSMSPQRFRVLDGMGQDVTGASHVDLATAFRLLDALVRRERARER